MKNITTFICLLFFSITITQGQKIRAFGDSFTQGLGGYGNDDYPLKLSQILSYPTQNDGVGGATSGNILYNLLSDSAHKSFPTIIWSGYNNINQGRYSNDVADAVADNQTAISSLGHQKYIVLSVINNCSRPRGTSAYDYTIAVNAQLKQLFGDRFLDIRDSMVHYKSGDRYWDSVSIADDVPNHYLMWDCVHANSAGYNFVAQKVSEHSAVLFANPLPVTFADINGSEKNNGIQINWKVATEGNLNHYEIERSADGRVFTKTASVSPKNNNNNAAAYDWFDATPLSGPNFYRIKSIDNSGQVKYSTIVRVNLNKGGVAISIYPNPVKDFLMASLVSKTNENAIFKLYNFNGALVKTLNQHLVAGANSFSIDVKELPAGTYVLEHNGNVSKFIK